MTKTISSRQNPLVQRIREAIREHGEEIVLEGPKQVADALASGWRPLVVATAAGTEFSLPSGTTALTVSLSDDVFRSLAGTRQPQGVLGLFERPRHEASRILSRRDAVAVALDGVQDPGNVGTIVRLAAAFDAAGVLLLPGCADPLGPKAIRASVGAVLNVPIAEITPAALLECGIPLFAADGAGDAIDPPSRDAILVFGNEGTGISGDIVRAARRIAIPVSDRVESLNVASAAAVLLARSFALRR